MDIQPVELKIDNPEVLDELDFSSLLSEPLKEPVSLKEEKEEREEEEEEETTPLSLPSEKPKAEEAPSVDLVSVINILADKGFNEVYEGFDPEADPTEETIEKLINHNLNLKLQEQFDTFFERLSEKAKRILEFDINNDASEEETTSFLKVLLEEATIKALDVTNEYDQEKILRMWYSDKMKFSPTEVEEKITELKDAALLEKEAGRIKPKLDQEAETIAKKREEEAREIKAIEEQVSSNYNKRVIDVLSKGEIGGIKLSKQDASQIYSFLTGDKLEITTYTGKKVSMPPLEAIIFYNKYNERGSLENLALASLLLTDPKKFDEHYSKKATTKATEEFVKEHKYSSSLKVGGEPVERKPEKNKQPSKNIPWRLKI